MSDARPKLKAVSADAPDGSAGGDVARPFEPETARPSRAPWWIAGLLVFACLALVIQTRRVGSLQGEVTRLSSELVGARTALIAYEGRLATVREVVGDLTRRVTQLDELVRRDPLALPELEEEGSELEEEAPEPAPADEAP